MKILLISNLFPTPWDEHRAAFNKQQISRLSKKHEIDVVIPSSNSNWFKYRKKSTLNYISGIRINIIPFFYIPGIFRFTQSVSLFISLLFRVQKLKKENYDCILAYWAYPDAVSAILISKILKKKVIIKVFGSDVHLFFHDKLRKRQILWAMHNSSRVLSVSADIKNKLIDAGIPSSKIQVLYDGVDKTIFNLKDIDSCRDLYDIDHNRQIILFVGNIIATKGVNELYDAFKIISSTNNLVDLYFVGDGNMREVIEKKSSSDGISNRVVFFGRRPLTDICNILSSSSLLCLPSYSEGVPNVLLEAKAAGIPVVATHVGGIPEIVNTDDGILVQDRNVNDLVKGLQTCLTQDWDHNLIAHGANRFSWDKNIELLDSQITSLFN